MAILSSRHKGLPTAAISVLGSLLGFGRSSRGCCGGSWKTQTGLLEGTDGLIQLPAYFFSNIRGWACLRSSSKSLGISCWVFLANTCSTSFSRTFASLTYEQGGFRQIRLIVRIP